MTAQEVPGGASAGTPSRTRLAPEVRRAMIVERATTLISERGFNAFTLLGLAEACGMTRRGLDHYFGSRDEILIAVLRHRDSEDIALLGDTGAPRDREATWRALDDAVRRNASQREIVRLYTVLGSESLDPAHPAHDYFQERARSARKTFVESIECWHPRPEAFATVVLALLDGVQISWLRDPALDLFELWRDAGSLLDRDSTP
ncbi:TetR/AcrR family transcriptional regulator [Rathayibacter sp. VKM Ac-2805]|uniref:TetR/AcrR family transcriptional regulator n=1 Tax=Rathayibacter sp. VKM Ac-2805 TaxID=2609258 RepID=UPI00131FACF6|nr:TetR/AcrR family transcriptional regulator [Rathayibacter sp. VKM Ac-2805]QHC72678.1 TetR family transcriptional regulator [Rathayibacter sp. VKM Ac-2805]